jgi:hypothetical protein
VLFKGVTVLHLVVVVAVSLLALREQRYQTCMQEQITGAETTGIQWPQGRFSDQPLPVARIDSKSCKRAFP